MDARPEVGHLRAAARAGGRHASTTRRKRVVPDAAQRARALHGHRPAPRRAGALAAYRAPEVDAGPVDAVNGAFMLMRRSALDEVGLFDEGYWMYMEDLDLCYRFAQAGWVTWYEPSATVVHVKAGTSGRFRGPRLNYAFHYGMYRFYREHYAAQKSRIVNAVVYSGIALKAIGSIINSAAKRTVRAAG